MSFMFTLEGLLLTGSTEVAIELALVLIPLRYQQYIEGAAGAQQVCMSWPGSCTSTLTTPPTFLGQ